MSIIESRNKKVVPLATAILEIKSIAYVGGTMSFGFDRIVLSYEDWMFVLNAALEKLSQENQQ